MRGDESTRFVDMEPTLHRLDAKRIVNDVSWAQGQENPEPITSVDDRAFKCKTKGADRTRLEESRMEMSGNQPNLIGACAVPPPFGKV